MNSGFTKVMHLVTLGKGLMDMEKLSTEVAEALYPDKSSSRYSSKITGFDRIVKLVIHSEDEKGQDIYIECHPDQEFLLRSGGYCKAKNLQGKRLISIGQNKVYCSEVRDSFNRDLLYSPIKMEHTHRDYVFINGIGVRVKSVY